MSDVVMTYNLVSIQKRLFLELLENAIRWFKVYFFSYDSVPQCFNIILDGCRVQNEPGEAEATAGQCPYRRQGNRQEEEEGRAQDRHHRRQEAPVQSEEALRWVSAWLTLSSAISQSSQKHHLCSLCSDDRCDEVDHYVSGCGALFLILFTSIRFKHFKTTYFFHNFEAATNFLDQIMFQSITSRASRRSTWSRMTDPSSILTIPR